MPELRARGVASIENDFPGSWRPVPDAQTQWKVVAAACVTCRAAAARHNEIGCNQTVLRDRSRPRVRAYGIAMLGEAGPMWVDRTHPK